LLPAGAALVGLVLGLVLAAATGLGGGDEEPEQVAVAPTSVAPTSEETPGATPSGADPTVTVPVECAEGLERARDAVREVPGAAEALRTLDTARLRQILDRLQALQPEVERLAERCRARVGG